MLLRLWMGWQQLWEKEEGQGMVEYGLIIALVAVVAIVALNFLGEGVVGTFTEIADKLGADVTTP